MSDDEPYVPRRTHDCWDCRKTSATIDGCPTDCDCICHSDESESYLAAELKMRRGRS